MSEQHHCESPFPGWGDSWPHLPAAEAQGGAGEVLVGEEGAVRHLVIGDLTAEAVAQGLARGEGDMKTQDRALSFGSSTAFLSEVPPPRPTSLLTGSTAGRGNLPSTSEAQPAWKEPVRFLRGQK